MADLNQITVNVNDIVPPDNFATVDAGSKIGSVYTKEQDNAWRKEVEAATQSGIKGEATPSTIPTPWASGQPDLYEKYDVKVAGTFTNFKDSGNNPIIISASDINENLVQLWVKNGVSQKVLKAMPQPTQFIPSFTGSTFPLISTTSNPIQRFHNDTIWELTIGQIAQSTDIPGASSKWVNLIPKTTNETQDIVDIFNAPFSSSGLDTSTFSGFGFLYGVLKNFNRVTLPIWQRASTTDEVTKVYLRIKEDGYQGTLLFEGFKDVTIPQGTQQDITFDFNLIENSTNKPIWVEFVCDGLTRLNTSNLTAQPYRYKVTTQGVTDFANNQSNEGVSPQNPMAISFKKVTNEMSLIPELVSEKVELGNTNPISSNGVYEEFAKYDTVIADGFQVETLTIKGAETLGAASSIFKGWGQLFAGIVNFNRVGYIFRAFDNTMIPTKVRCVIRKTSSEGTIVFDKTKDVSLLLNTNKKVYFDLPELYTNSGNDELFISFFANGMIASFVGTLASDLDANHVLKYTVASLSDTASTPAINLRQQLYVEILKGHFVKQISDIEIQRIATQIGGFNIPDVILTSKTWIYPNFQYNIYDKNVVITNFGDTIENYRIDYTGSIGQQLKRGFRLNNTVTSINQNITLNLLKGRNTIYSKSQNVLSSTLNNGSGVTRKVLVIGDSTIDGGDVHIPLKGVFDADVMDLIFLGTRGTTGLLHEGRGGWTFNDYYGFGRKLYRVDVSGLATPPTTGSVYKQTAGNDFKVVEVNITSGAGYFKLEMATGSVDLSTNGTLTKQNGAGESILNYTNSTVDSSNPFYSPTTQKFDLGYYLANTGQSIGANDWIIFQLGINDVFSINTLAAASVKVSTMITQLNDILANITSYNNAIRVGIVVTIPPAGQDAFGANYSNDYTSEMYQKTGLVTFQKALLNTYDNDVQRALNRYLISAHLNLDTDYNFPTAEYAVNSRNTKTIPMQNNGVHPDVSGNYQIADMYAGVIKYFA